MTCKGIIYRDEDYPGALCVVSAWDRDCWAMNDLPFGSIKNLRKVGHNDLMRGIVLYHLARDLAKAYFSKKPWAPKVGDKVRVASAGSVIGGHVIGTVGEVTGFTRTGNKKVKSDRMSLIHSPDSLEPVFEGSYSERQKAWCEFHGIDVGSEVKVTGPNVQYEDGSGAVCHSQKQIDEQSGIAKVCDITSKYIEIRHSDKLGSWSMPYTTLQPQ